ncbi:hypothetical protein Esi_0572_0007 [Ectocarpus siliculosus]|uniref:Uncharacterized protein n=1 Tax=Ectocarpus siliculosus TaxID=2880 RepID=D7G4P1_ECTSI|nr:hypothetical protein Esi_0572_0007 [Ectocarpus siliculosus]|eukprot:CBJ33728.1 hypothetical protein Esi_0572_0007 [Ectocarpus siliculosus]
MTAELCRSQCDADFYGTQFSTEIHTIQMDLGQLFKKDGNCLTLVQRTL